MDLSFEPEEKLIIEALCAKTVSQKLALFEGYLTGSGWKQEFIDRTIKELKPYFLDPDLTPDTVVRTCILLCWLTDEFHKQGANKNEINVSR